MTKLLIALLITALPAFAADAPQTNDAKMQDAMKAFMQYSTPGENHKMLTGLAGKWSYTSKMWQTSEAKPEESKGTSTMKNVLGGRFLMQEFKGKAMGKPFEGMGFIGYDNLKQAFQSIWMDSMGTGMVQGQGTYDTATKTIKENGEFSCPMTGDKARSYRAEWVFADKAHMNYSMWTKDMDGKEFKSMEIAYNKAK